MNKNQHLKSISKETLETFEKIADKAKGLLRGAKGNSAEAFASINTMTSGGAVNNLDNISERNRETYQTLLNEPSISRIVVREECRELTYYISRNSSVVA